MKQVEPWPFNQWRAKHMMDLHSQWSATYQLDASTMERQSLKEKKLFNMDLENKLGPMEVNMKVTGHTVSRTEKVKK
jgi:hypothetical protein